MSKRRKKRSLRPASLRVKKADDEEAQPALAPARRALGARARRVGPLPRNPVLVRLGGGVVGGAIEDGIRGLVGAAGYVRPRCLIFLGGLMVTRSELVDVRPFRRRG